MVVGRDGRASGEMLEAAVIAGLTSAGADVLRAGVLPTPAIAHLVAELGADFGVVLSASHNPMPDNGIKLFARGGHKLADAVEDEIEARVGESWTRPTGAGVGRARDLPDAADRYADYLLGTLPHKLDGMRLVVDCAHGAASAVGPVVLTRAGAEVTAIAAAPDGENINDGVGSTHLAGLVDAVRRTGADVGIAFDGDADRCLAVSSAGEVVDGDAILAICALALREQDRLRSDTVVATVMSNLGLHHAMRDAGIRLLTTPVGDRYVLEALREQDLSLGGEQSGHVVFADRATTGDGLLTALQLLGRVAGTGAHAGRAGRGGAAAAAGADQRAGGRPGQGGDGAGRGGRGRRGRGRARRRRPGAAAPVRHRADRPGHGRGADPGRRRRDRPAGGGRGRGQLIGTGRAPRLP